MGSVSGSLDWIDGFIDRIRPHVHVRLRDTILIRMPNEAYRLNPSGARILHYLLKGGSIAAFRKAGRGNADFSRQVHVFFADLSRLLSGPVCDDYRSPGLERVPFELGYVELPVLSEVAVTGRCNIRCRFCYASCRCGAGPRASSGAEEMSTSQIKRVLAVIRREAEVPSVSFTGGEPLLRADLAGLIGHASRALGMRVNLITNGTLITRARAEELKKAGLASAQVSLESPDPDIHDRLVGTPGAWHRSLDGLRRLRDAGVPVHAHSTICRLNRDSLERMPELAASEGLDRLSMNMVIPAGRGRDSDLAVRYSEMEPLLLTIMAASRRAGVRFLWYSPTPLCLFNPVAHGLGNKGCSACDGLLSVDPSGRLLPCSSWPEPLGSLLDEGFEDLWFGNRAVFLRNKGAAPPGCPSCEHFAVCNGACPLYYESHGYGELESVPAYSPLHSESASRSQP